MTELRARLADALRLNGDTCTRANAEYLADLLLSLPGIAIVDLPEARMADVIAVDYWDCDGEQDTEMHLTVAVPEDFGSPNWREYDAPTGKRRLAAALLAAANAAEQSS